MRGGRFNRPGQPALYLALDIVTAVLECAQGLGARLPPVTLCEYDIDCAPIADLTDAAARAAHHVAPDELACPWLSLQLRRRPVPSQLLATRLAAAGLAGAIVPSFVPGADAAARNLVLWRWGPDPPTRVAVHDPSGRLPRDQLSWR